MKTIERIFNIVGYTVATIVALPMIIVTLTILAAGCYILWGVLFH